jgi:DNA-binding response OmpR family regulator
MDLSSVLDALLPLRHIQRLLRQVWGEEGGLLPTIAMLTPAHLMQRGWQAFVADFALPPYGTNELLTRIQLLFFRRQQGGNSHQTVFEDVTLDLPRRRAVTDEGSEVPLTPREYDLLHFLLTHRGKLFARERILDLVWGVNYEGGARTVDIHIRRLRAKLPPRSADLLETRRGVGYGFLGSGVSEKSAARRPSAIDRT